MKRNGLTKEMLFQIFSLLVIFILVHATYVALIRPSAQAFLKAQQEMAKAGSGFMQSQNIYVVLKDYEQEACIVLMLWALSIMAWKAYHIYKQQQLLEKDILQLPDGLPIGPEDTHELQKRIMENTKSCPYCLLPRALRTAIQRFAATLNVHDAATAVRDVCDSEAERQEAELSIIRYIAWAIPSVGFIGTVRGIGAALAQANKAVEGDITGVTQNLGVAFNSTFVALVLSIVLMFFIHQLQLMQERLVLDTEDYCEQHLISRLHTPVKPL
ncbi:MAG: MotA/TolQ/ExbB proton channel family protein [Thermodesulfobacteria bacterium]|nr:MotA/TolQ/ExbB proton channel family protein [Thermodesulfobacteriota bacterium]